VFFERYATGATALFRRAVDAGYKGGSYVLKDPNLEAIRGRKEFNQALWKMAGIR